MLHYDSDGSASVNIYFKYDICIPFGNIDIWRRDLTRQYEVTFYIPCSRYADDGHFFKHKMEFPIYEPLESVEFTVCMIGRMLYSEFLNFDTSMISLEDDLSWEPINIDVLATNFANAIKHS